VNAFAKKFALWLSYSVAVLLILAATLVSFSRMLTPYLNSHRHDFEVWASEQLHAEVTIEQVHITWYYNQPVLTFEKVVVLDPVSHTSNFNIRQIKVNLQVLPSLWYWQPMPKYIKLLGADLVLREQAEGKISIEGNRPLVVIENLTGETGQPNAVLNWIMSQPRLVLDDINLKYIPLHDTEKSITLDKLSLKNEGTTHELKGNARLNQEVPVDVQLEIHVSGDVTDLPHLSGQAYFYLQGVSLPQWIKQSKWQNMQLLQGFGSGKVWLDWQNSELKSIHSELQIYNLEVKSLQTNKKLLVSRVNGLFGWKRDGDKQTWTGQNILLDFPERLWPTTGFSMTLAKQSDGSSVLQALSVDYLDISDVVELAFASGFVSEKMSADLKQLNVSGDLKNLKLYLKEPVKDLTSFLNNAISSEFSKLSFNAWQLLPKMTNVTGQLSWDGQQGQMQINSQKITIDLNSLFTTPLFFEQLKGNFNFQKDTTGNWILQSKNAEMVNADLSAKGHFALTIPEKGSSTIDLTASFSMPNVTPINKYMPVKILEPELAHWLQNTFYDGKIVNGQCILQGQLSDFPFDKNNGKFLVSADIQDLDFEYAPKWPAIKHLSGKLVFSGHTMTADVSSGQMVNINLKKVHAEIPYIGPDQPQILKLQSVIDTDLVKALEYIQQSPLQKTLGNDLAAMKLTGPMQLNLSLSIPLKTPENTVAVGDIVIPDAELNLSAWNLKLPHLQGSLHFTDKDIKATDLKADLFGEKIALNIDTTHAANALSMVVVKFQGNISIPTLQNWFQFPKTRILAGSTTYAAQLNLTSGEQSFPNQLIITSDLKGMSINLPDVYGKKVNESRDFQLQISMNKQNEDVGIKVTYGNVLSTAATLHKVNGKTELYSGELHLGGVGTADFQSKPGLLISGQFDQWDLSVWQHYLTDISAANKPMQRENIAQFDYGILRGIDLTAKQFSAHGVSLHNAHIQASQEKTGWSMNINSSEIAGQIFIPNDLKKSIDAKLQYLYLSSITGEKTSLDPKTFPPISFFSHDVRYNDMDFGSVNMVTVPIPSGLSIQTLQGSSASYNFNAKGEWNSFKGNSKTFLQGALETKDVAKLLHMWGVKASNLVESGGTAQFDLHWVGTPYHPDLNTVSGDLSLKLTAGRIIDLSNSTDAKMGIGKMLNIFNVSNIPRRLSLNFRDFENGYSFDSMQGHFNFKNGSLFTQDTIFTGPIARIEISGRIGFVAKDYDIEYSVTPYGVTSSLPVVATVVGGPVAGAATWLVDKVVGSAVSSVITHHYTVRGPWSHPEWSER
jgi:uncharacterized protein (TIGR02099 family)